MSIYEKLTVLIVDDDPTFATAVAFLLRRIGVADVRVTNDAESAWSELMRAPVDLVISDWNMEPVDGYQLLKMVRGSRRFASLGYIMMTANTSGQYPRLAIEAGASFFLAKPFRMASLKAAIDATLGEAPVVVQARLGGAPVTALKRDRASKAPRVPVSGLESTTPDRDGGQCRCGTRQDIRTGESIVVTPSRGDC